MSAFADIPPKTSSSTRVLGQFTFDWPDRIDCAHPEAAQHCPNGRPPREHPLDRVERACIQGARGTPPARIALQHMRRGEIAAGIAFLAQYRSEFGDI